MANPQDPAGGQPGQQVQASAFVAAVAPGGQAAQGTMVTGYLGESGAGGRTKLYLDPSLKASIEFDPTDVVHTQQLSNDPLGATGVWLRNEATVTVNQSHSGTISSFLQGPVAASALPQAGVQGIAGTGGGLAPAFLSLFGCDGGGGASYYDSFFICRSRFICNPQSIPCLC